jgi:hypothetical protein
VSKVFEQQEANIIVALGYLFGEFIHSFLIWGIDIQKVFLTLPFIEDYSHVILEICLSRYDRENSILGCLRLNFPSGITLYHMPNILYLCILGIWYETH